MKTKSIIYLCFLMVLISCNVNENVVGTYRSNVATLGFFTTEIKLKEDNTFGYAFSGDLQHVKLDGKYKIEKNILYLRFKKLKEEYEQDADVKDSILDYEKLMNSHWYEIKNENGIEYHIKYKISKQRLFVYNVETNELVKRVKVYRKGKNRSKKYFLNKVKNDTVFNNGL